MITIYIEHLIERRSEDLGLYEYREAYAFNLFYNSPIQKKIKIRFSTVQTFRHRFRFGLADDYLIMSARFPRIFAEKEQKQKRTI